MLEPGASQPQPGECVLLPDVLRGERDAGPPHQWCERETLYHQGKHDDRGGQQQDEVAVR